MDPAMLRARRRIACGHGDEGRLMMLGLVLSLGLEFRLIG